VGRLQRDYAPAEWGGYNERERDRHALRCSHSSFAKPMEDTSADVFLPSARFARFSDFATFGHEPPWRRRTARPTQVYFFTPPTDAFAALRVVEALGLSRSAR